ncbi:hypothetical protein TNCV_3838811 [Trichonephila clavipes]|nr:hypothetical protein TNCV_3838811 [Trichonephila clavipes]
MFQRISVVNRVPAPPDLSTNGNHFTQTTSSAIFTNIDCRRNCSCNNASLPHPTHKSGDSLSSRPIHIRSHITISIWDGGTLLGPFPSDVQRQC